MTPIVFFARGEPKGQPRPRAFARNGIVRVYDPGTAEGWKSQIAMAAKPHIPEEPMLGTFSVAIHAVFSRPKAHRRANGQVKPTAPCYHVTKPDCDNVAKAVLDALTTVGMWRDDRQVARLTVDKVYGDEPGAIISITNIREANHEHPTCAFSGSGG